MSSCKLCGEPLVLQLSDVEGEEQSTVPDDLELQICGCHFHWQCLMDQSSDIGISLACPSCNSPVSSNNPGPSVTNPFLETTSGAAIIARYTNEGGVEDEMDLLPYLTEEAYLESHPEARPSRAMLTMCGEGDILGLVEMIQRLSAEISPDDLNEELMCYQDPFADMKSGLHLAIEKSQEEVVWLLLWLGSSLETELFPETARQTAESLGLNRPTRSSAQADIRSLKDASGQTAEDLLRRKADSPRGLEMVSSGVLKYAP